MAQTAGFALLVLTWRWAGPERHRRATMIAAAAAVEIVALFATPLTSYPRSIPVEMGGVRFLQHHLGLQRFVTLGPIAPNYGSYFGIAQVNHNDLPVPHDWVAYARRRLDWAIDPIVLAPPSAASLLANLPRYAAIGTRYAVAPAAMPLPGLIERYADSVMRFYELPDARPYLVAPSCRVSACGWTEVELACTRASRLERLELSMPGWSVTVTVNGRGSGRAPGRGVAEGWPSEIFG